MEFIKHFFLFGPTCHSFINYRKQFWKLLKSWRWGPTCHRVNITEKKIQKKKRKIDLSLTSYWRRQWRSSLGSCSDRAIGGEIGCVGRGVRLRGPRGAIWWWRRFEMVAGASSTTEDIGGGLPGSRRRCRRLAAPQLDSLGQDVEEDKCNTPNLTNPNYYCLCLLSLS